jgi:hypothetical protein
MFRTLTPLIALITLMPLVASAQLGLVGLETSVVIVMSPQNPGPHQDVQLTAQSSVFDLSHSDLTWRANGKVIGSGTGATRVSITTGGFGSESDVTVDVIGINNTIASASATIIPTSLDLLYESDAYAPPFYQGRTLPSPGSSLVLQAMPHFFRPSGAAVAASDLTYTWRKNGQVLGSLSGKGKYAVVVPAPVLYGRDTISVEAHSTDGLLQGEASLAIAAQDPQVLLYEDHPIFGLRYSRALTATTFTSESEMTFAAIPYFAGVHSPFDTALHYGWTVNSRAIASDRRKPNELTLQAGDKKTALIAIEVTHDSNYFLDAQGTWNVTFSQGSVKDAFSPQRQ